MIPAATPHFHGHRTICGPSAARLRLLAGVTRDKPAHVLERLQDETRAWFDWVGRWRPADDRSVLCVTWNETAQVTVVPAPPLCSNARWEARR